MKIFKVTLYGGYCHLIKASSYEAARKQAMSEEGSSNVQYVDLATEDDIEWVRAMGGRVPELDPVLPSEWAKKGVFVLEGWKPKVGAHLDYYDHDGIKRQGTVKSYDGETIVIDGEHKMIIEETFKVRQGRN